jgi:hypothetical protein
LLGERFGERSLAFGLWVENKVGGSLMGTGCGRVVRPLFGPKILIEHIDAVPLPKSLTGRKAL